MNILGVLAQLGFKFKGNSVIIPGLQQNIGAGKTFWLDATNGTTTGAADSADRAISTLTGAYGKVTTGKNDVVRMIAGASAANLAAGLTWAANNSHLVGEGVAGLMNQRARIGHSANFGTLLTISGYGNSFQDLYIAHGRGHASNLYAVDITGPRNSFHRVHFGGPFHATEAGTANYRLVRLQAAETYFKDCVFGQDTIARTAANSMVEFGAQAEPPRSIFENCLFLSIVSAAGGAGSTFLKVLAGCGAGLALFRNCTFINIGGTAMTLGIDGTGLGNFKMHFENSTFIGCTDVVAAAQEAYCTFQACSYTSGATLNGLGQAFDHTP